MLIIDWLNEFITAHETRHPREDWPGHGLPESRWRWSTWFDAFKADRITQAEALAASAEIDGAALDRWEDHLPALIASVKRIRERKPVVESLEHRTIASLTEDERLAEAQRANAEVGALDMAERIALAERLLDEFHELGWHFVWHPEPHRCEFTTHRSRPDAPQPNIVFSTRLRALKRVVYALLGHPMLGERPLPEGTPEPKRWREMLVETSEGMAVIGGKP